VRRSWPRMLLGFVVGFGVIAVLLLGVAAVGIGRDLPTDLMALRSWQAPPSLLLDASGAPIATFALVEPVEDGPPPPSLLAEAFFAAAPPPFYEARVDVATTLPGAVLRVLRGRPSSASPLSLALARALLVDEAPGARRQAREELVATWLEGATTVTARVEAWLDEVPLCRGRRGLARARRECLGTSQGGWTDIEMATIAAAAAWDLDLAGDPHLLAARRDAVLEQLVRRGLIDPDGARRGGLPPRIPPPPDADCKPQLLAGARRAAGVAPGEPVRLETGIDGEVRDALDRFGAVSALLADSSSGLVRACRSGGDGGAAERAAPRALLLAGGGQAPGLRWLPGEESGPPPDPVSRVEAWTEHLRMEETQGVRWSRAGDRVLIVHPALAGAVTLADVSRAPALVEALAGLLHQARVLMPDDLEVVQGADGLRVRARGDGA
jgi:hypothetical protein